MYLSLVTRIKSLPSPIPFNVVVVVSETVSSSSLIVHNYQLHIGGNKNLKTFLRYLGG